jgi:hypothetical protein
MRVGIRQLADEVGREVCTLRRWEREGKIPPAHRAGLKRKRWWTPQEAAEIRAQFGAVPEPTDIYESLRRDVSALLGVEPSPTLQEGLQRILGGAALPGSLDGFLEALAPVIAEAVEELLGDKATAIGRGR